MDLQEFHDSTVEFVERMYETNIEPDYDIIPFMAAVMLIDGEEVRIMHVLSGGSPLDLAHALIHAPGKVVSTGGVSALGDFTMISFVVPMWRKTPEGERIGEGVIVVSETPTKQISALFDCTRTPLPTLTKNEQVFDAMIPRVELLYHPNHTEH